MRLEFKIKTLSTIYSDDILLKTPPYYLIGFNEIVDSKIIRRSMTKDNEDTKFILTGNLPIDKRKTTELQTCCLMISLYQSERDSNDCWSTMRVAENIVEHFIDFNGTNKKYEIILRNRRGFEKARVLFEILKWETENDDEIKFLKESRKTKYSLKMFVDSIKSMNENYKKDAFQIFQNEFIFTDNIYRRIYTFSDVTLKWQTFLNSYLMFEYKETNQLYWSYLFVKIMNIFRVENTIENADIITNFDLWKNKLTLQEKISIFSDMISFASVGTSYMADYIYDNNGKKINIEDWSNIHEGSGDCEDLARFIYYCFNTFKNLKIKNMDDEMSQILAELSYISDHYIPSVALMGVYSASMDPSNKNMIKKKTAHLTHLLIHKNWIFNNSSNSFYKLSENDSEKFHLLLDREHEYFSNEHVSFDKNNLKRVERMPNFIISEGTGFFKSYGSENYYGGEVQVNDKNQMTTDGWKKKKSVKENINNKNLTIFKSIEGTKSRCKQYNNDDETFFHRFFISITNYFIDNDINIPYITFTPSNQTENTKPVYGVNFMEMMYEDESPKWIHGHPYKDIDIIRNFVKIVSLYKHGSPPLKLNFDVNQNYNVENRIDISQSHIKFMDYHSLLLTNYVFNEYKWLNNICVGFDKYKKYDHFVIVQPNSLEKFISNVTDKQIQKKIEGYEHIQLLGDLYIYIFYLNNK